VLLETKLKEETKKEVLLKKKKLVKNKKPLKNPKKKLKKMMKKSKNPKPKTPLNYYPLPPLTSLISKPSLSIHPINKMPLISYGKIMMLQDSLSGTSNIKDMKVKESSSTLPPISRTPLSKDSILSENTFSELSVSTEMKETLKSEESGCGEELKFLPTLRKIYPTSNITIGSSWTTPMLNTKSLLKNTGLDKLPMSLLLMV
jgi:hypothetical protein